MSCQQPNYRSSADRSNIGNVLGCNDLVFVGPDILIHNTESMMRLGTGEMPFWAYYVFHFCSVFSCGYFSPIKIKEYSVKGVIFLILNPIFLTFFSNIVTISKCRS